jgi:hypothetical protein
MESSINENSENNSQNKNEIYKNQIKSILECLKSPMARPKALEAILGLCESEELTEIFISLELPKIMIRLLENEDIKEKDQVLQILINISGKESYLPHFLKINTIHRILNLIFKTIKSEFEQKDKEKNNKKETYESPEDVILESLDKMLGKDLLYENGKIFDVKMEFDKYVINADKVTDLKGMENETFLNLYFMFLCNLTSYEPGQKNMLDLQNENKNFHGVVFFKLLDKFFEYIYHNSFNFCSAIIANISSLKEGRKLILENKIFKIFLIRFDKMNAMKTINIIRLIRNCSFEYKDYVQDFLEKDSIMFKFLIKLLCLINNADDDKLGIEEIDNIYLTNFDVKDLTEDDKETLNDLIVDIFLILTNSAKAVDEMKNKKVKECIELVEEKAISKCKEDMKNKLIDRLLVIKDCLSKETQELKE